MTIQNSYFILQEYLNSKVMEANNNHYAELVKDISSLFRNDLGTTNYSPLADMFGLPGNTTASNKWIRRMARLLN